MTGKQNWFRDRSALVRLGAVVGGLALAVAGCGTMMPGGNTSGQDLATQATAGPGPGVSDDSVKVVFVAVDLDAIKEYTGFNTASVGDQEAQVQALEDWVNDNGGIDGRQLDAVFRLYDAQADSPAAEEQLCNQITQDDQAFAVVMTGQYQTNARPCYADRQTLVLDASLYAMSTDYLEKYSPYLWTASFPEYDSFVRSYVTVLDDQGFFEGEEGIGVVAADSPVNRDTIENLAVPLLKEHGIEPEIAWVDTTDTGTLFQGLEQGAITFRSKGIERVMFLGGSRMASVFATVAGSQDGFKPRYAISSFDNPSFFVNNDETIPPDTMNGMVGIGFHPPQDVPVSQFPFPTGDAETECLDIYGAAGIEFESRESARVALPYCDAVRLLKLGGDALDGELNAAAWAQAVDRVGATFQSASGPGNALGDGGRAAIGSYRVLKFDEALGNFVYEGDEVPFDE
ncbi:ABC transporter substrate-binding protein [Nocardioides sp. SR21]|uniref:ABC transporter substrate-binding protein n=1 Tax=Nocardioides sp. SR21 TaxID=2919501 RepID=UPI001FAAD855|nr:ABC transporter substrate-binding protein [Nocardioides sp. SR21]